MKKSTKYKRHFVSKRHFRHFEDARSHLHKLLNRSIDHMVVESRMSEWVFREPIETYKKESH